MAMVFVFLVLAAQYESWAVPFSVLLGLPICVFGALLGVTMVGLENNVYVQIGIVALMGLAAKNAILIVEFAKENHERKGMSLAAAAMDGARLRFRPIMMTAFAFILGVVPLVTASGAGACRPCQYRYRRVRRHALWLPPWDSSSSRCSTWLFKSAAYVVGGNRKGIQGNVMAQPALPRRTSTNAAQPPRSSAYPLALAGCTVGSELQAACRDAPPQFRAGEAQPGAVSLGDSEWFDLFQDDSLRGLIQQALQANYDVRIAAQRVLQAEGQLTATRSGLFPQLTRRPRPRRTGIQSPVQSDAGGFFGASWEVDSVRQAAPRHGGCAR